MKIDKEKLLSNVGDVTSSAKKISFNISNKIMNICSF